MTTETKTCQIDCPHCGDLFAHLPPDEFDRLEARCESDEFSPEGAGDCGKVFFIGATDDGYRVDVGEAMEFEPAHPQESEPLPVSDEHTGNSDFWPDDSPIILPHDQRIHPALPSCTVVAHTEAHTDEWHQVRARGVGSSDAGAILGWCPHSGPVDVWKSKVGEDVDRKPWLDDYATFGTWFEGYIRTWCEEEFGCEIIDGADLGTLQSTGWHRAQANIDGLDITAGAVEEYKTTSNKWTEIPPHYEAQCQHQMYVTGAHEVRLRQFVSPVDRPLIPSLLERLEGHGAGQAVANWLLEHGEIHTWIVERNDHLIGRMIAAERDFWSYVEMEVEPPKKDPEGTVDLSEDPEAVAAIEEYARIEEVYEQAVGTLLNIEGVEVSSRGSAKGTAKKLLKKKKRAARKAIEKAITLDDFGAAPKRVRIGDHKATWIQKDTHGYWRIYTGEANDPEF